MKIFQQFLTVVSDDTVKSINDTARKMILSLVNEIKKNRSSRRNACLIYEVIPEPYIIPREYSKDKTKTKWELFAESKGIKNRKKSQLEYCEELKKWVPKWGRTSIKNMKLSSGVVEVEKSFSQLKKEKKDRIKKNLKNCAANKKKI